MTDIAPYFIVTAGFLAFAWILATRIGFYRALLAAEASDGRFLAIDGLRGYLVMGVFFHHAAVNYYYYQTERWESIGAPFYTLAGQIGVPCSS